MLRNAISAALLHLLASGLLAQPVLTGTVQGTGYEPLSGARIELVPVLGNFEAGLLRLEGRDEIRELEAGDWLLRASLSSAFLSLRPTQGPEFVMTDSSQTARESDHCLQQDFDSVIHVVCSTVGFFRACSSTGAMGAPREVGRKETLC